MAITYLEAIREAQARALKEHDNVYIYGQDVSEFGGAFKATKGLSEMFPGRVLDSPISEDAMIGSAVGAAIEGMTHHRDAVCGLFLDCFQPDCEPGGDAVLSNSGFMSHNSATSVRRD